MTFIQKYLAGTFMIVVSLIFLIASLNLEQDVTNPGEGSFLPAAISVIMLLAGIKTLFEGRRNSPQSSDHLIQKAEIQAEETEAGDDEDDDLPANDAWTKKDYGLSLSYFALTILYVISLPYLSFFVSTFIFLVVSMLFLKGVALWKNVLISLITVAAIYVIFEIIFQIVFP